MAHTIGEYETVHEAIEKVAARNRLAEKRGFAVAKVDDATWEHTEPEDSALVPDSAGLIYIETQKGPCCSECDEELEQCGRMTWYCPSCNGEEFS